MRLVWYRRIRFDLRRVPPRREITHDAGRREMINSRRFIDTRDVATTKLLACPLVPLKYLA
jgi:hypothetical protein